MNLLADTETSCFTNSEVGKNTVHVYVFQDLTPEQEQLRSALKKLTLSNEAVWERERKRPPVEAPWWILGPYYLLCTVCLFVAGTHFNDAVASNKFVIL